MSTGDDHSDADATAILSCSKSNPMTCAEILSSALTTANPRCETSAPQKGTKTALYRSSFSGHP